MSDRPRPATTGSSRVHADGVRGRSSADAPHPATLPIDELLKSCEAERFRASGPGGQHRNKVETGVRLVHRPTAVTGRATERRRQEANRKTAVFRLRVNLALQVRTALSPASGAESGKPASSPLWRSRVRGGRLAINPEHDDFPALLAEALDRLAVCAYDHAAAASVLGVSASQLLRLLRHDPRALEWLNARRAEAGRKTLR